MTSYLSWRRTRLTLVLEPGLQVTGQQFWAGRVRVTDPVLAQDDPVFVVFARALLMLLEREYATLESEIAVVLN